MPPSVDDAGEVTYPRFDHGEDLIVASHASGVVEFRTREKGEFIWTNAVVDLRDMR